MKLPAFLSKPRWQSKDAAVRRAAVARDGEPELVADLGRLAREDADPGVRIAAMQRLADPGLVQGLARDDADADVRRQARALWFDLMAGTHAAAPELADRLRLLKAQDDAELIEHLARRSRDAELRLAALERSQRPALLFERALEDADAGVRAAALARIDDEAQLLRLAERARKTDKQINRLARERVEALRIGRGDDATLEQRARALCERLEQLVREPQTAAAEAEIAASWGEIEARTSTALRQRYDTARNLLVASRSERVAPAPAPPAAVDDTVLADAEATPDVDVEAPAEPAPDSAAVNALIAQARFTASLDSANAERQQQRERQQALFARIETMLAPLTAALGAGKSAQAHAAKVEIDALRRQAEAPLPRALATRLADAEQRYAELSRWQHWADSQRRQQLCEEIEALAIAGLHPDAVAARVRDAQNEWNRLDALEGPEAARHGGLARRFHAACRGALAPARAYFKKRQELRESQAQRIGELLERAAASGGEGAEATAAVAARRDVVAALRDLDRVEPRERKALAERLRSALAMLDARIAAHDDDIAAAKQALIGRAEALTQPTLQRGAVAAARELQQRWQAIGHGRRDRDQAQWKSFRAAIDAVFGRLDSERAERSARDAEVRGQAETVCAELEALAADAANADRAAVARIDASWNALGRVDEGLGKRFEAARAQLREAAVRRERDARHARFAHWLARYRLCREAEQAGAVAGSLRERWEAARSSEIAGAALDTRFARADAGSAPTSADDGAARDVLIELEMFAGMESPGDDRERRRVLQVERLSARMRGGAATQPAQELAALLTRWSELEAADAALDQRLERALAGAIDTLP
ncbi:DUF349 domain-containing protein [Dokdonella sp.]|uniref:DUF349 domain-containing protein n=1 Tax=Dokdonella sp. TaxID=2291710 RepID=UPI001B0573EB|nr:DUF349 domain-containing protein [Dokdonella sp.]MBO9663377.1 DUF349 domain-containing protein [Dokdonella sp.]